MIIKKIYIGAFGKLKDYSLDLSDGLNLIYGENEAGKSTIQAFIKAMLYGMNSQKKSINENSRKKYMPWGAGKAFGKLYIRDDNSTEYIIERSFGTTRKEDKSSVINSVSGEKAYHINEDAPGKDFFGIGEEAFEKTIMIDSLGSEIIKVKEDEIIQKLINLEQSGDSSISFQTSKRKLEELEKSITNIRRSGILDNLRSRIVVLSEEEQEIALLQENSINLLLELNNKKEDKKEIEIELQNLENEKNKFRISTDIYQYINELPNEQFVGIQSKRKEQQHIQRLIDEKLKEASSCEELLKEYEVFTKLEDNVESKVIALEEERKAIAEKLSEFGSYENELTLFKQQYTVATLEFKKYEAFKALNNEVETTVHIFERELSGLRNSKNKIEGLEKKEKHKNRLVIKKADILIMLLGIIIVLLGVVFGKLISNTFYIFSFIGILTILGGMYKYRYILLDRKEHSIETEQLLEKERELENDLELIYKKFGVVGYEQFIDSIQKFRALEEKCKEIAVKIQERENILKGFKSLEIIERIDEITKYLDYIIKLSEVKNIIEFRDKLNSFRELKDFTTELSKSIYKLKEKQLEISEVIIAIEKEMRDFILDKYDVEIKINNKNLIDVEKAIRNIENEINNIFNNKRELCIVQEEIVVTKDKIRHYENKISSVKLAKEVLQETFDELQQSFGPKLNSLTAKIISEITSDKYNKVMVGDDFSVKFIEPSEKLIKDVNYLSSGTFDQVYLALRLALAEIIFEQQSHYIIILDDAFIKYDDRRLKSILYFLLEYCSKTQIILFSCQKREYEFIKDRGNYLKI